MGVSPYLTLDKTGNLEKIFLESTRKTEKTGDVGGSIEEDEKEEFRPQFENSFDGTSSEEEFKIEEYKATL